jgi:hypothetical protein
MLEAGGQNNNCCALPASVAVPSIPLNAILFKGKGIKLF